MPALRRSTLDKPDYVEYRGLNCADTSLPYVLKFFTLDSSLYDVHNGCDLSFYRLWLLPMYIINQSITYLRSVIIKYSFLLLQVVFELKLLTKTVLAFLRLRLNRVDDDLPGNEATIVKNPMQNCYDMMI